MILVLAEGRPRIISRIADKVSAVLLAFNPSNEGGRAISDVLFGDYNPNGKLPVTYPRFPGYLATYDRRAFETDAKDYRQSPFYPQFEFGSGLSYTTFKYSDLRLSAKELPINGELTVSVKITNTGTRAGKETAILYLRDEYASITPQGKRVKRFAKIYLAPGQSKIVTFKLSRDDFSFVGLDNKSIVETGDFTVMIGDLSEKFALFEKQ